MRLQRLAIGLHGLDIFRLGTLGVIAGCLTISAPSGANVTNGNLTILASGNTERTTQSGDLIILLESLAFRKSERVKILDSKTGVVYRMGDTHFISSVEEKPDLGNMLNEFRSVQLGLKTQIDFFESSRSIAFIDKNAPRYFRSMLMNFAEDSVNLSGRFSRTWKSLKVRRGNYGELRSLGKGKTEFFQVPEKNWNQDKTWNVHFYIRYEISVDDRRFEVIVFPKEFGGAYRAREKVKVLGRGQQNTLVLNTGNSLARGKERADFFKILEEMKTRAYAVGSEDLLMYGPVIRPYMIQGQREGMIQFISANVYNGDGKDAIPLFRQYVVEKFGDLKIGIIGITDSFAQTTVERNRNTFEELEKVEVRDPGPILQDDLIPKLRDDVDMIILLSNLRAAELGEIFPKLRGIDLVIGKGFRKYASPPKYKVQVDDFLVRHPRTPLLVARTTNTSITRVDIDFSGKSLEVGVSDHLLEQDTVSDEDPKETEEVLRPLFTKQDVILPDHQKLYPNDLSKLTVTSDEFGRMAAHSLREVTDSELGIFHIQEQRGSMSGELDASIVRTWVRREENLVIVYMTGNQINSLLSKVDTLPATKRIAISGIDENGGIHGEPIQSKVYYRVATSSAIADSFSDYPDVASSSYKKRRFSQRGQEIVVDNDSTGKETSLHDALVLALKAQKENVDAKKEEDRLDYYRSRYEGLPLETEGYWSLEFKDLSFNYSEISNRRSDAFDSVLDSQVTRSNQTQIGGHFDFSVFYRENPFIFEIGTRMRYSKTDISADGVEVENINEDDAVIFTGVSYPWLRSTSAPFLFQRTGPFFEFAYDTEFSPAPGKPKELLLNTTLGWRLYEGSWFKQVSLGGIVESELTSGAQNTEFGVRSDLHVGHTFFEDRIAWNTKADMRYFFPSSSDTVDDLKTKLSVDTTFHFKIVGGLTAGPFYKFFLYTGKTFEGTGTQSQVGLSVQLRGAWKPRYQPFGLTQ